jgi:ferredoxin-type protein NapH
VPKRRDMQASAIRRIVKLLLLLAFASLVAFGRERFWLPIMLTGIISCPFLGRWYCRWACPVDCASSCARAAKSRAGKGSPRAYPRRAGPRFLREPWFRALWFSLLVFVFVACLVSGLRVGLFIWVTALGVLCVVLFPPGLWCGTLCPWGGAMLQLERLRKRFRPAD